MYLIDGHKYSFDQITTGHNSKKTYNRSFTTLFLYKDRVCSTAHQITDQWFIKRRVGRKNINGNVEKNFFFVLYRTYLHHSYSTTFSNIICRIKNLITGIFEKCFLVICDWDEKKVYSASSKKPRHTEMLKHNIAISGSNLRTLNSMRRPEKERDFKRFMIATTTNHKIQSRLIINCFIWT